MMQKVSPKLLESCCFVSADTTRVWSEKRRGWVSASRKKYQELDTKIQEIEQRLASNTDHLQKWVESKANQIEKSSSTKIHQIEQSY